MCRMGKECTLMLTLPLSHTSLSLSLSSALTLTCPHPVQVWDAHSRQCTLTMSNHNLMVTSVKWGGEGLIYSASRDCR